MTAAGDLPQGLFLLLALGVSASAGCLALALAGAMGGPRRRLAARIARVAARVRGDGPAAPSVASLRRASPSGLAGAAERIARRLLPRPARLQERLVQAGFERGLGAYALASLVIGGGAAFAALALGGPPAAAPLAGLAAGAGLPHLGLAWLMGRRARRFAALFPEAIELIVRGVKSGLPVPELVGTVADEIPDPVGGEFRRVADAIRLGQPLEEALWAAARRIAAAEFRFFVVALSVQRETGGNLAETLANLAEVLRRRRQMRLKVRAMSSEARASAYILGALPFIMLAILFVLNTAYVTVLFADPRGHLMLAFGGLTISVGALVMARMVRFEI